MKSTIKTGGSRYPCNVLVGEPWTATNWPSENNANHYKYDTLSTLNPRDLYTDTDVFYSYAGENFSGGRKMRKKTIKKMKINRMKMKGKKNKTIKNKKINKKTKMKKVYKKKSKKMIAISSKKKNQSKKKNKKLVFKIKKGGFGGLGAATGASLGSSLVVNNPDVYYGQGNTILPGSVTDLGNYITDNIMDINAAVKGQPQSISSEVTDQPIDSNKIKNTYQPVNINEIRQNVENKISKI